MLGGAGNGSREENGRANVKEGAIQRAVTNEVVKVKLEIFESVYLRGTILNWERATNKGKNPQKGKAG